MSAKKNLLIFVPDGTGIKNYLLSDFLKHASNQFNVIIAHNFDKKVNQEIKAEKYVSENIKIPPYQENIISKFYRESITYARLLHNAKIKQNETILRNWRRTFKFGFKYVFYKIVEIYGLHLSKNYNRITKLNKKYHHRELSLESTDNFLNILEEERIDIVFTTHQRSVLNVPLFAATKKLNITSVSVIYSWDNMPKARIPYFSDYFFVWSKYMKMEFDSYYPEISKDRIIQTGTPQFEFYLDKNLIEEKNTFYKINKLDKNRPVVCFSGDDRLTSPFDPNYLRDMAEVFSKLKIEDRPQIILRPCPADNGERFKSVLKAYPEIIYKPPDWFESKSQDHWSVKFPKRNDIKQLVNLAYHADAVVNVGSTMAHDFAMFEKPAFYLNYMPQSEINLSQNKHIKNWSIKAIYKYQHFKSMQNLNPVYWINKKEDFRILPDKISNYDKTVHADQKKWRDKIIGEELYKKASLHLVTELLKLN
jgi:hypothetical protein